MYFTKEEEDYIIKYYPEGGVKEVEKFISRTGDSIRHRAKKLGIKRVSEFRNNKLDISNFLNITDYKTVYLLGLLWGDGRLTFKKRGGKYNISIRLGDEDMSDIHFLFDNWSFSVITNDENPSWKVQYHALLSHKELATFLLENDFLYKSILSPRKILSKIPDHLKHYFWRGYFDADGSSNCLLKNKYSCCFSGNFEQSWEDLEILCEQMGIEYYIEQNISKKGHKSSIFIINGRKANLRFLYYIYRGEELGLSRKYENYKIFFNDIKNWPLVREASFKGAWERKKGIFNSFIVYNRQTIQLGKFTSKIDAAKAYDKKCCI